MEKHSKKETIVGLLNIALTDLKKFNYSYLSELDEAESLIQSAIYLIQEGLDETSPN